MYVKIKLIGSIDIDFLHKFPLHIYADSKSIRNF